MATKKQQSAQTQALRKLVSNFRFGEIYLRRIDARHGECFELRSGDLTAPSSSRFSWKTSLLDVLVPDAIKEGEESLFLYRFIFQADTTIVTGPDKIPDDQEIPSNRVMGAIGFEFVVEYLSTLPPERHVLDGEVLDMFMRTYIRGQVWSFWQEALSSATLRLRLPTPSLPLRAD